MRLSNFMTSIAKEVDILFCTQPKNPLYLWKQNSNTWKMCGFSCWTTCNLNNIPTHSQFHARRIAKSVSNQVYIRISKLEKMINFDKRVVFNEVW